jgi:hypothetical protein
MSRRKADEEADDYQIALALPKRLFVDFRKLSSGQNSPGMGGTPMKI